MCLIKLNCYMSHCFIPSHAVSQSNAEKMKHKSIKCTDWMRFIFSKDSRHLVHIFKDFYWCGHLLQADVSNWLCSSLSHDIGVFPSV